MRKSSIQDCMRKTSTLIAFMLSFAASQAADCPGMWSNPDAAGRRFCLCSTGTAAQWFNGELICLELGQVICDGRIICRKGEYCVSDTNGKPMCLSYKMFICQDGHACYKWQTCEPDGGCRNIPGRAPF